MMENNNFAVGQSCPACGAPVAPGEKFCQNCGTKLPEAAPAAPVVEAPVVEAPVAESPVVEAPVVEAPVVEAPVAEAPVAESPVAEAPVVEAPVVEAPVAEAPVAESPVAEAPVYQSSAAPVPPAAPVYQAPVTPAVPVYQAPAAPVPPAAPVYQAAPRYTAPQNMPGYAAPNAAPQYAPNAAPQYAPAPAAKPKKKKTGLIIGLCAGAAVLLAAAILLYFFVLSPTSVSIVKDGAVLAEGETITMECYDFITLNAEVNPGSALNKNVTWASSNEDIATVFEGLVTGYDAGTCTITATTSNGKTATCTVTVEVAPYAVYLSEYYVTLGIGEELTIEPEIYPENAGDKSVTWTSDDPSVATVSNGTVTAVGEGSCNITATTSNGVSESCIVFVSASSYSSYDSVVLGNWYCTEIYDMDSYETLTTEEFGMDSSIVFYDDHTAIMTFGDETSDEIDWEYSYTDSDGDYNYTLSDGVDDVDCYYIVDDGELWLYIDNYVLTYKR